MLGEFLGLTGARAYFWREHGHFLHVLGCMFQAFSRAAGGECPLNPISGSTPRSDNSNQVLTLVPVQTGLVQFSYDRE